MIRVDNVKATAIIRAATNKEKAIIMKVDDKVVINKEADTIRAEGTIKAVVTDITRAADTKAEAEDTIRMADTIIREDINKEEGINKVDINKVDTNKEDTSKEDTNKEDTSKEDREAVQICEDRNKVDVILISHFSPGQLSTRKL